MPEETRAASLAGEASSAGDPALRLGISTCLLGEEVRHDGGHKRDAFLLYDLGRWVEWVPVCPEYEMGLGAPREAMRLVGTAEAPRLVTIKTKVDLTDRMLDWSRERLHDPVFDALDGYVLKKNSPSCGLFRVKIYDGNGVPAPNGRGIFAMELTDRYPLLPVEEEGRLNDPRLRERFIELVFAHHRWRRFLAADPTPGGLVEFHGAHKMTLMAHDPNAPSRLGRLVAGAGDRDPDELFDEYGRLFMEALAEMATPRKHTNVLEHLMGFLKQHLEPEEKQELREVIHDYRKGLLPLVVPLTLLRHHFRMHDVPDWARKQIYLNPYPKELMLRNHV